MFMLLLTASTAVTQGYFLMRKQCVMFILLLTHLRQLHKELYDEKTMHHVYILVSRIYGRLFLYLMNSKSDTTYTRTYLLMRKQCLMFMLLLAASECAEKKPLKIKFRKDVVESYKPIVWAEPRPISMLQNVSHLLNNHLFLRHMLLSSLRLYT